MVLALSEVGFAEETALLADVDTVAVRYIEETFFKESGRAVRNHAVTFHLSESQTTVTSSSFSWLASEDLGRAAASRVDLVADHMLEPLVIGGVEEDHNLKLLASKAVVHDFISVPLIPELVQLVRDELDCLSLERSRITLITIE